MQSVKKTITEIISTVNVDNASVDVGPAAKRSAAHAVGSRAICGQLRHLIQWQNVMV